MTNEEYMKYMKSLGFLADHGVVIVMISYDRYEVKGFYKSDYVLVNLTNKTIAARYDKVYKFEDWWPLEEHLLSINKEWWGYSKERWDGWSDMDEDWQKVNTALEEKNNG